MSTNRRSRLVPNIGQLWHTIRNPDGKTWQPFFGLVEDVVTGGPPYFNLVACGSTDGESLQVVGVGNDLQLWHTIRNSDGKTWQPFFGLVESEVTGGPPSFYSVDCAGTSQGLQVVGLGSDSQLWHTIRYPDGTWQPFFGLVESVVAGGPSVPSGVWLELKMA
jgi:hypothetical protein